MSSTYLEQQTHNARDRSPNQCNMVNKMFEI